MTDRAEQVLAGAGIAFAVALAAAGLIDDGETRAYLLGLAAFFLAAFVGALRAALRSVEGETAPLSATAVIGGSVVPVLYALLASFYFDSRGSYESSTQIASFAFAACFPQAAVLAAAGTVMVRTGAVSVVLGRAGQALTPVQLALPLVLFSNTDDLVIALALGLFAVWVAATGALLLRPPPPAAPPTNGRPG